jgi:hypothetical protein
MLSRLAVASMLLGAGFGFSASTDAAKGVAVQRCEYVYYAAVRLCNYSDGSATVTNVSSSVVNVDTRSRENTLTVSPYNPTSFTEYAAELTAPPRCYLTSCDLPPKHVLTASPATPTSHYLYFSFRLDPTIERNLAIGLATKMLERLYSPGQRLGRSVASCASSVGAYASSPDDWASAIRAAVPMVSSCKSVVNLLRGKQESEATFGKKATQWARTLGGESWIDEMFELFGKVVRR